MNEGINKKNWWSLPQEKILAFLHVVPEQGLDDLQVIEHRKKYGTNILIKLKQKAVWALILEGIKEPMMLLLLTIALLSLVFGKIAEALAMVFVVIAYISVEFINKYRTDKIMTKLKNLAVPSSKVIRNSKATEIKTADIVVGDILVLSEGASVPADARLLSSHGLLVNEASLTGESLPIKKSITTQVQDNASLAERFNCVWAGTTILSGEGTAIALAVGRNSEFGKIAQRVQETQKEKTILQESMTKLAKLLAIFAIAASLIIPAIGFLRGLGLQEMILTWLSLTFLMIPGQPPIIITIALTLGAFALAKKHVIVKRIRGVEIVGQVTSIVSDKTGTITESAMVLETFYTTEESSKKLPQQMQDKILLAIPDYSSDPTDRAVLTTLEIKQKNFKQVGFTGFSDHKPWRDLIYQTNGLLIHAIAGSPELLIEKSTLSSAEKQRVKNETQKQAHLGKRVTAYGFIENKTQDLNNLNNLNLVALAIIHDPVRQGVKESIATLEKASINTFIVTGDHTATAQAIASEIGLSGDVITGDQFDNMSDKELVTKLKQSSIFARMDPLQKLRLVKLLQQKDEVVAVIGDGVNDAPALKAAQVGIAMGQIGTDLAKEVSDLILTDDNYVHIPDAIAIGRKSLDNFKKGLSYYLSAKSVLLVIFIVPLFLVIPFPFAPIQIILIELLMDLASSTIFATEEAEPGIMERPSQKIKNFLGKPLVLNIAKNSLPLALGILLIYVRSYHHYNLTVAQTAAFVGWLLGHILLALNLKQEKVPLTRQGIFSNYFGIFWLLAMILLSITITMIPDFYPYLKTTWLPLSLWFKLILIIVCATFWIELVKLIKLKKIIDNKK